jgi:hypothetical protein
LRAWRAASPPYQAPFDQPVGQAKAGAPALLDAGHTALVGFVVHTEEVEDAVEHQDADFGFG